MSTTPGIPWLRTATAAFAGLRLSNCRAPGLLIVAGEGRGGKVPWEVIFHPEIHGYNVLNDMTIGKWCFNGI